MTTVVHDPASGDQQRQTQAPTSASTIHRSDRPGSQRGSTELVTKAVFLSPCVSSDSLLNGASPRKRQTSSSTDEPLPAPFTRVRSLDEVAAKKKVLLHDVDVGAKCLSCEDCPGFQLHVWRKICSHCRCPWESHDIFEDEEADPERTVIYNEQGQSTRQAALASLKLHLKQMSHAQNPVQDKDVRMNASIIDDHTMFKFSRVKTRRMRDKRMSIVHPANTHSLQGPCYACSKGIRASDTATLACPHDETSEQKLQFHFGCFLCEKCDKPIAGPDYYSYKSRRLMKEGKNPTPQRLCGRCHAEKYLPRCAGCDELIFDEFFTHAEDRPWHQQHFCCNLCDAHLGGKDYTKTDDGYPVCIPCYNTTLAPTCHSCKRRVGTDEILLEIGQRSFHGDEQCFKCAACNKYLYSDDTGGDGVLLNDKLYCRKHAADATEALIVKCFVCKQRIAESHVKVKDKPLHSQCFKCAVCELPFTDARGRPQHAAHLVGERLLCPKHAEACLRSDIDV